MNWYQRSYANESCADPREFLDGAANLFGGSHNTLETSLSWTAGYLLGHFLGRR